MNFKTHIIKEAIQTNIENGTPLVECMFRRESEKFQEYFQFLKENQDAFELSEMDKQLLNTDIGETALFEGEEVHLDIPFVEEIQEKKMDDNPCWAGYVMVGMKMKNGKEVPNCVPEDEVSESDKKDVELNKPKRNGGPGKKYYVYTKNAKGNVIKINFGDEKGGLTAKISDPAARKSFVARHNCDQKNDKTKAGYWSCRLPYYADALGLSGGGSFFW